ncbi:hypothetical protein AD998_09500 [bacterium 336/3]|jgi:uncharacterized membrane protein|nr:hypothetical protein AD998_09500 [bacterium 336/3]
MTKNRLEAFSDGIIAIIITIMVFDIKMNEVPNEHHFWVEFLKLYPKIISYMLSFLTLAIMWVNHHQLFHQIKQIDRKSLWYNIHLLFWMSLVPFGTNLVGANPTLALNISIYSLIFLMNALSFSFLRGYAVRKNLLLEHVRKETQVRILKKNILAVCIYASAAIVGWWSVYISYILLLIVPIMYFIPEKITSNEISNS